MSTFPLMANRKYRDYIIYHIELIERHVATAAARNEQFTIAEFCRAANERMIYQNA